MSQGDAATGFFTLRDAHGGTLFSTVDGKLFHALDATIEGAGLAWLFIPRSQASIGFFISEDAVHVEGDSWRDSSAIGFCLKRSERGLALRHPSTGRYLCANLPSSDATVGRITVDRHGAAEWEVFIPTASLPLSPGLLAIATSLQKTIDVIERADFSLASFADLESSVALTVLEMVFAGRAGQLAAAIGNDPQLAHALACEADPWLRTALPSLAHWIDSGRQATADHDAGPELDFLAHVGEHGVVQCFGQLLNHLTRRSVTPSRSACIIATARNEGVYLLEWLAYHRALGFEHFFITSNDNTDESDGLLAALAAAGVITWTRSRIGHQVRPQCKAYSHTLQFVPDVVDFAWAAIIDLDEFIVLRLDLYPTIADYLRWQEQQPVDAIALNWRLAGSRRDEGWCDDLVVTRFTASTPDPAGHVKSISRPGHFMHSHPHRPYPTEGEAEVFAMAPATNSPSALSPHTILSMPGSTTTSTNRQRSSHGGGHATGGTVSLKPTSRSIASILS